MPIRRSFGGGVSILPRQDIFFPYPLRFAVNADRFGDIGLSIWFPLFAIEDVIGAEMNQFRFFARANFGEHLRRFGIDRKSLLSLRFAKIDICHRSAVDQQVERNWRKFISDLLRPREVKLRVIQSDDVEFSSILARERTAEAAASAQD